MLITQFQSTKHCDKTMDDVQNCDRDNIINKPKKPGSIEGLPTCNTKN
jgi:hypothetical protein